MEGVLDDCLAQFSRRAAPDCFRFTGAKGCCGGSSHGFWEMFLNLPVVRGNETQTKRKERGISCTAIAIYYHI